MNLEWRQSWGGGGGKRRIVLHSKVLFRRRVRGGKKLNKKDCDERCHVRVRVKTFSPSPRFPPPESGYEEGTVSITQIK